MVGFEQILEQQARLFIAVTIPESPAGLHEVKLHGVESGGIWIEQQALTEVALELLQQSVLVCTPIMFVPYSSMQFAVALLDKVALSEKLGS